MNAARGVTITPEANESDSADTNADGETSVYEIWCWENYKDNSVSYPQFSDNGSISAGMFLDIPPYTPVDFELGTSAGGYVELSWVMNIDYDFNYYEIYRALQDYPNPLGAYSLLTTIYDRTTTTYIDEDFSPGTGDDGAAYKIRVYDLGGHISPFSSPVGTHGEINGEGISGLALTEFNNSFLATPNPFNPSTTIRFDIAQAGDVSLIIYDIAGREVAKLIDGFQSAGSHSVTFDGTDLSSGIYFARLQAGEFTRVQKLVLMK